FLHACFGRFRGSTGVRRRGRMTVARDSSARIAGGSCKRPTWAPHPPDAVEAARVTPLRRRLMNERQKKEKREKLEALALRFNENVAGLKDEALRSTGGEAGGNLSNAPVHLADLASANSDQEIAVGLLQNQEQVLRQIAAALERLDTGTFGRCE